MIKKLIGFSCMFWMSCACGQPLTSSYANLFETGRALLVVTPNSVALSDLEFPARRCKKNEKFECIISKSFIFSIPKVGGSDKEWSHLGAQYRVLSRREIILRGELIEYLVIRQTISKDLIMSVLQASPVSAVLGRAASA